MDNIAENLVNEATFEQLKIDHVVDNVIVNEVNAVTDVEAMSKVSIVAKVTDVYDNNKCVQLDIDAAPNSHTVLICVDISHAMCGPRIQAVKGGLKEIVTRVLADPTVDGVGVLTFGNGSQLIPLSKDTEFNNRNIDSIETPNESNTLQYMRMIKATPDIIKQYEESEMETSYTDLYMILVNYLKKNTHSVSALVVVAGKCTQNDHQNIASLNQALFTEIKERAVSIDVIGYGNFYETMLMDHLVKTGTNQGNFTHATNPKELTAALSSYTWAANINVRVSNAIMFMTKMQTNHYRGFLFGEFGESISVRVGANTYTIKPTTEESNTQHKQLYLTRYALYLVSQLKSNNAPYLRKLSAIYEKLQAYFEPTPEYDNLRYIFGEFKRLQLESIKNKCEINANGFAALTTTVYKELHNLTNKMCYFARSTATTRRSSLEALFQDS